jgi:hypothetical protein
MQKDNQRFLVTYVESNIFQTLIENENSDTPIQLDPKHFQYVKCVAPTYDDVGDILRRRFSDVEVIGVAQETDYVQSLNKLENQPPEATVYVAEVHKDGTSIIDIFLSKENLDNSQLLSEVSVESLVQKFQQTLQLFHDDSVPTVFYDEKLN